MKDNRQREEAIRDILYSTNTIGTGIDIIRRCGKYRDLTKEELSSYVAEAIQYIEAGLEELKQYTTASEEDNPNWNPNENLSPFEKHVVRFFRSVRGDDIPR